MDIEESSTMLCLAMQKISYGLGHIFNDLCAAMWFSYTLFYLQIVLSLGASTAGLLLVTGQVVDSIATPVAGYCIDYIPRRRLWHLGGTIAVGVGFALIFSLKPNSLTTHTIVYYVLTISLFQIGWAIVQISHLSIIPEISRSQRHSSDLTAIRYMASVCCNICVYLVTLFVLKTDGVTETIGPNDFYKFKEIAIIIIFIGSLSSLLFYCGLLPKYEDEEIEPLLTNSVTDENEIINVNNQNNKHFLKSAMTYSVSIMYMCSRLFSTLNLIYIPLYISERGQLFNLDMARLRQSIATIPLTAYIASFLTSVFLKFRFSVLTNQITYFLGSLIGIVASIWIGIGVSASSDVELYTIAALLGITGSMTMVSSLCFTADFVKNNGFGGGQVYSIVTFTDKLISGSIVLVVQHLHCAPKESYPTFYKNVLTYISASVSLVSITALLFFHIQSKKIVQIN